MKIIPTWPRASLPWFQQIVLQDCSGEKNFFFPRYQFVEFAIVQSGFFFIPTEL